jgi:hypothetical protein
MLTRENFLNDWCSTLGENRWLTLESVIEYVNSRETRLREELDAAKATVTPSEDTSFDEILVGETVYTRAGGLRVHAPSGRNLRVYTEEGNALTQVAELKTDTTAALIAELTWCIEEGQSGPRTRGALKAARAKLEQAQASILNWSNGCDTSVPAALRFLAKHPRPNGGEQTYNAEHLNQLASEIESTVKRSHTTAVALVEAMGDLDAYRSRAHAAERGCHRAGLVVEPATGEWSPPAVSGKQQPGAVYQVGKEFRGELTWTDVDYATYANSIEERKSTREVFGPRPKLHARIVFQNPSYETRSALDRLGEQHLRAIRFAQIGSCTCMTKTPEFAYHKEDCRYRVFWEVGQFVLARHRTVGPQHYEITPKSGKPYIIDRAPDSWELRECGIRQVGAEPAASIFKQFDCLQRWADAGEFWEAQMYGNRFYFGEGGLDYVPRDVLRAFIKQLGFASPAAADAGTAV